MPAIRDVDLATYCGRIGNLYTRHGLCPPFELRRIATQWQAQGIAISHIVAVIDRHLTDHPNRYHSGSGDALFTWLDEHVRRTWDNKQHSPGGAQPSRRTLQRMADHEWVDWQQKAEDEWDLDRRHGRTHRKERADNGKDRPGYGIANQVRKTADPVGQTQKGPKRIDQAIAFLRRELAGGEVAAARLEEKAKASHISARTLDRARARLNITYRRTGFAKDGKCWLSLRTTPNAGT